MRLTELDAEQNEPNYAVRKGREKLILRVGKMLLRSQAHDDVVSTAPKHDGGERMYVPKGSQSPAHPHTNTGTMANLDVDVASLSRVGLSMRMVNV